MKFICLIALLFTASFAVSMKRPMTNAQIQKFQSLKKDHKWAGIMMNLAELHIQSQAPLDELIETINVVVEDIERKTERAHNEYDRKTDQHNAEVARINSLISSAQADVASIGKFLNEVLYVQRDDLTNEIARLEKNIETTKNEIEESTNLRAAEHSKFLEVIIDHNEALAAIEEAKEVLSQLQDGQSLLQVKRAKKSLEKVQQKIRNNVQGSLAKALLELASGEFANREAVQKVANLLNEVASNLTASIAKFTDEEEKSQSDFEALKAQKENDINRMSLEKTEATESLEKNAESIKLNEELLAQRQRDLVNSQADLVEENANYDIITANYEDLVAQLTAEARACAEALQVLSSSDIAGYIGGRMEQDVIIDQPHGTGINVESKPFQV